MTAVIINLILFPIAAQVKLFKVSLSMVTQCHQFLEWDIEHSPSTQTVHLKQIYLFHVILLSVLRECAREIPVEY